MAIDGHYIYAKEKLTEAIEILATDPDDAMATSAMIALAYQLGRVIRSRDVSKEAAQKATVEVTKTAFLSGLIAWAVE